MEDENNRVDYVAEMDKKDVSEALLQKPAMEESLPPPETRCGRLKKFLIGVHFKLYCSYFLSSWGDRMWAFALSIAMGVISGDLQYTAASALVNSATVLLFASIVGKWIDRTPRLKAARTSLIANNTSVALSAAILVILLFFSTDIARIWNGRLTILLVWLSIALCACSMLANVGTKICVTKDWVVVISGTDTETLAEINSMMVRIDMTAYVLSPLLAGQVMWSFGTGWGCAFIAFWNIGSFAVEYYTLWAIYQACPALAVKRTPAAPQPPSDQTEEQSSRCNRTMSTIRNGIKSMADSYRTYFRQSVLLAGLALSCLYLSVVSFDGNTLVYLASIGMPENLIALSQGLGAIMGIAGSVAYPRLRRRVGVDRTGLIALTIEWSCLLLPVASVWLPGSNFDPAAVVSGKTGGPVVNSSVTDLQFLRNTSLALTAGTNGTITDYRSQHHPNISLVVFLIGVILSRMGLWMADLAISQIFQETIAEEKRGVVNGVQNSLNSVMDMAKSILVIILPNPRTFGILIVISWLSVVIGYVMYCRYSRRKRGHLLPFHKQFQACVSKDGQIAAVQAKPESEMGRVEAIG